MPERRVGLRGAPSQRPHLADGAREQRGSLVAKGQRTQLQLGGGILPLLMVLAGAGDGAGG